MSGGQHLENRCADLCQCQWMTNSGFGARRLLEQGHGWHALTAELWFERASCPEQPGRETGISGGRKGKRKCGNPVFLMEEAHLRTWNGLCAKINTVYSLSSWRVCLVDLIISVLFLFWRGDSYEASLTKVDGHFYGPLVGCSQGTLWTNQSQDIN